MKDHDRVDYMGIDGGKSVLCMYTLWCCYVRTGEKGPYTLVTHLGQCNPATRGIVLSNYKTPTTY